MENGKLKTVKKKPEKIKNAKDENRKAKAE